ncbi:MAG: response regulator [Cellvibrionaceae bacterium]|nr:response regulator [Cellvibrionaceae bacterium]
MEKVLIVEDSHLVAKVLVHIARQELDYDIVLATTFAEAQALYAKHKETIFAALVDLNLPDAKQGEVVDFTLEHKIPTIVLTGSVDDSLRQTLLDKGIVDYVTKEGRYSYQYAVRLIKRLQRNQRVNVLVVEDSKVMRKHICNLLCNHRYKVLEAVDGIDAIKVLLANVDIRMLITDYNMPNMDGFELVKNLRHKYEKFDLIIIGLSAEGEGSVSAKFIKSGANDFLSKPFNPEEFYCRINHSIESLELVEQIRDVAQRDYLTNLYSRRHFFLSGEAMWNEAKANNTLLALAILNLDDFKVINEKHGNVFADDLLKNIGCILEKALFRFTVARASGKEFYVLLPGLSNPQAVTLIDKIRLIISREAFVTADNNKVFISCSGGVSNRLGERLQDQIAQAELYMRRAKQAGKNIVFGEDEEPLAPDK